MLRILGVSVLALVWMGAFYWAVRRVEAMVERHRRRKILRELTAMSEAFGLYDGIPAVTHDYTVRSWGHDYSFHPDEGGMTGQMVGWGAGLREGDYLLLRGEIPGTTTRYRIERLQYRSDPKDMWVADVVFAPRAMADAS